MNLQKAFDPQISQIDADFAHMTFIRVNLRNLRTGLPVLK
jgi:hypothetical protein